MAELINTNVFAADKKFVDFAGLDYFWEKAKAYVDGVDAALTGRVKANEDAISSIQDELNSLSGGAGSIATQIDNAISRLDLPNTYEAKGEAAKAQAAAEAYADGLAANYDEAGAASAAEAAAKAYADGLVMADGVAKFDAAGSAAAAEAAAKEYADGLDGLMDERVKVLEAVDHAQLAADASAAAVATVLDGAPEAFDTLKEVAQWIADSESASSAADLVTRVAALEAVDHEAYKAADEKVLEDAAAAAKAYADGLASNYEVAGEAAKAEAAAKAYADGLAVNYDEAGAADQALADAKSYADGKFQVAGNYEVEGAAAQALVDAKSYVDGKVDGKFDAAGSASAAQAAAIAQAKADAAETLKGYYTKTEVDNLLATNTAADQAYAKQYTDELFGSFKFAQNSDIDALFAAAE